jgi:hypothetical protein
VDSLTFRRKIWDVSVDSLKFRRKIWNVSVDSLTFRRKIWNVSVDSLTFRRTIWDVSELHGTATHKTGRFRVTAVITSNAANFKVVL